jgi:hypothetical protein
VAAAWRRNNGNQREEGGIRDAAWRKKISKKANGEMTP